MLIVTGLNEECYGRISLLIGRDKSNWKFGSLLWLAEFLVHGSLQYVATIWLNCPCVFRFILSCFCVALTVDKSEWSKFRCIEKRKKHILINCWTERSEMDSRSVCKYFIVWLWCTYECKFINININT